MICGVAGLGGTTWMYRSRLFVCRVGRIARVWKIDVNKCTGGKEAMMLYSRKQCFRK
jgi:hypothetical protein